MTNDKKPSKTDGNGVSARDLESLQQRGYQPQASAPANLAAIKPPHGDTAIVTPHKPAAKR